MRILVVDDDEFVRSMLSCILCRLWKVDEAENGKEAVYKFAKAHKDGKPYDVIIMDYQMPVMDGREALSLIRILEEEQTPDKVTTVFISSGYTECSAAFNEKIDLDPYVRFIGKPFNLSKFINDIKLCKICSHKTDFPESCLPLK